MDAAQVRAQARQPGQQAQVQRDRRRLGPGRAARPRRRSPSWATTSSASATRTRRAAPTRSPPRAASTPPRTTRTTATASGGSSTTRSRAATSARARPTSTGWPRCRSTSSTSAWRRACPSRASTAGCSPTARSAAPRCRAPSTPAARPASSSCSAPTRRSCRQIGLGKVRMYPRAEMLDLVVVDGRARGIVARDLVTGEIELARRRRGGARHRRLRQRVLSLDQRQGLQRHRHLARPPARRLLRQPVLHADPSDLHPAGRRLPVEAHADVRVAAQRRPHLGAEEARRHPAAERDPGGRARLLPGAQVPGFGNLVPRDIASRAAKEVCDEGRGVGPGGRGVYLDFADAIERLGTQGDRGALRQSLRDVPEHHRRGPLPRADAHLPGGALHDGRPVGGLRPDVQRPRPVRDRRGQLLRPRRQPPGRLGADAGAGRRLLHPALHDRRLPGAAPRRQAGSGGAGLPARSRPRSRQRTERLLAVRGERSVDSFHRELGH